MSPDIIRVEATPCEHTRGRIILTLARSGDRERVRAAVSDYLPIAEHGLIGDLHSAALVGTDGTIDWFCCPRFDSPSVFASILDSRRGGHYRLAPIEDRWTSKQLYFPETNVLITRFLTPDGVGEVEDFMPVALTVDRERRQRLVRRVVAVRGELRFELECAPRFDYGRAQHTVESHEHGVLFRSSECVLALETETPLRLGDGAARASFVLSAGESATFILEHVPAAYEPHAHSPAQTRELFDGTVAYWRRWLSQSRYTGRWREMVHRSALTLKLLTYDPTGAIVAAATSSLPEQVGGERNWDYRYTWIRDAAFSLYALLRLGFRYEAEAFMAWLTERFRDCRTGETGPLQVMYGIDGRAELPEERLTHLEGYQGSAPVRMGNGAANQLQLDIYGELIDSVYLYNKHGNRIYHDAWADLTRIIDWLSEHWDQPDEGIWESRGGRRHFTYSRLMSWVAFERAVRIARQRGLPGDIVSWMALRDTIYRQIVARGWHAPRGTFVQHYDSEMVDASILLMPLVKFISPTDPRWLSTLDAIGHELVSDSLVSRYDPGAAPDGLVGDEGTFCTFWYVEALARAGEQLGNFPQAFTHLALISAATNLDRQLG